MINIISQEELCDLQCVNCPVVPEASSRRSTGLGVDSICVLCRSIMEPHAKIEAEPDVEYEFDPIWEEYDPYEEFDEPDDYEEERDDGRYDD